MPRKKPAHNIAKVTHYSGRSANISPARLRVEEHMANNCQAYTSHELGTALGITTHNASRILREMRHVGMVKRAGLHPETHRPRWAHRNHVRLHTFDPNEETTTQRPTAKPRPPRNLAHIAHPRTHVNGAMPNGSPEYWASMMNWGR